MDPNIPGINRILGIYTLLKQFQLSKLIEVEKYQHQQTTLLQLGLIYGYVYYKSWFN